MAKVSIKTDGCSSHEHLTSNLEHIMNEVENKEYLQNLLSQTMFSLYILLPDGRENYGGQNPHIGSLELTDCTIFDWGPHGLEIKYFPSARYCDKFGYLSTIIGSINLQKRTYFLQSGGKDLEEKKEVPPKLIEDTAQVMNLMGLRKQRVK